MKTCRLCATKYESNVNCLFSILKYLYYIVLIHTISFHHGVLLWNPVSECITARRGSPVSAWFFFRQLWHCCSISFAGILLLTLSPLTCGTYTKIAFIEHEANHIQVKQLHSFTVNNHKKKIIVLEITLPYTTHTNENVNALLFQQCTLWYINILCSGDYKILYLSSIYDLVWSTGFQISVIGLFTACFVLRKYLQFSKLYYCVYCTVYGRYFIPYSVSVS